MRWDCAICGKNKSNRKFIHDVAGLFGRGSVCKKCVKKIDSRAPYGQYAIREMRDGLNGNVEYLVKWADEKSI